MHATHQYLDRFDFVLLSETQLVALPQHLLPRHVLYTTPASADARPGEGLLIGVRRNLGLSVAVWPSNPISGTLWLQLRHPADAEPHFLGVCYMPGCGLPQLRSAGLRQRFAELQSQVSQLSARHSVAGWRLQCQGGSQAFTRCISCRLAASRLHRRHSYAAWPQAAASMRGHWPGAVHWSDAWR